MAWVESEPHLAATSVKRFFFWIQLSRLARVYTRVYNKRERSALEALLTLEGGGQEGFSFSSRRSIDPVRPTRFVPLSFLPFFLLLFFLFPLLLLFLFPPLSLSLFSPTFLQRTIRTHYAGETMAQRSCRAHASGRISRGTAAANFAAIFTVSVVENSLKRPASGPLPPFGN